MCFGRKKKREMPTPAHPPTVNQVVVTAQPVATQGIVPIAEPTPKQEKKESVRQLLKSEGQVAAPRVTKKKKNKDIEAVVADKPPKSAAALATPVSDIKTDYTQYDYDQRTSASKSASFGKTHWSIKPAKPVDRTTEAYTAETGFQGDLSERSESENKSFTGSN